MNTGIKINNVEIKVGDIIYCSNIKNDALNSIFSQKLSDNVLDAVLIKFVNYEPLNFWTVIMIPFKKGRWVVNGHYMEVAYDESFKTYNNPKVDSFDEPPLKFLHDLLRVSSTITINDERFIESYNEAIKNKNIDRFTSWCFEK